MTNWININDLQPEISTDVLVYCNDSNEQFVAYKVNNNDNNFCYATGEWGDEIICEPSHWMSLPTPPEVN